MKSVPLGYPLKVLEENERWYKVELKDKTAGWVYKTMVFNDVPLPLKISELESKLKEKTSEFEEIKSKFEVQAALNSELDKNLKETQQELNTSLQKNEKFEKQHDLKLAAIGIIILILGWGGGFVTGFLKRQTEDKRFIKMMVEANSLRKVSNSSF
jgi:CRISPR/Cas system CSM-associated protein Csm5 (group 7 of RAMP superfamily)